MEPDGIQNAWIAKVLIRIASTSAITTRIGNSRQNDRCRACAGGWPGVRAGPPAA